MKTLLYLLFTVALQRFERSLKKIIFGLIAWLVSALLAVLGVAGLMVGFFFALADMKMYITPALITGGILLLLAILAGVEGMRFTNRRR